MSKISPRLKIKNCVMCHMAFIGGPNAKYCPDCRQIRKQQLIREAYQRRVDGQTQKMDNSHMSMLRQGI